MAKARRKSFDFDYEGAAEFMGAEGIVKAFGAKRIVEAIGPKQVLETFGLEHVIETAGLENMLQKMDECAVKEYLARKESDRKAKRK